MKTVVQTPIEKELVSRLDSRAKAEDISRAALIRLACTRYLRQVEDAERERIYEEGHRRIPEETTEAESLAWLAAVDLPDEDWPRASGARATTEA